MVIELSSVILCRSEEESVSYKLIHIYLMILAKLRLTYTIISFTFLERAGIFIGFMRTNLTPI